MRVFSKENFLIRTWAEAESTNTNKAGREYIVKVRQYVEGLLRLMLRGEEAAVLSVVVGFVIGESRDKLRYLHQKGLAPWDRPEFKKLVGSLGKRVNSDRAYGDFPSLRRIIAGDGRGTRCRGTLAKKTGPCACASLRSCPSTSFVARRTDSAPRSAPNCSATQRIQIES